MLHQVSSTCKFKPCYHKIRETISVEDFEKFSKLNENEERFKFLYELNLKHLLPYAGQLDEQSFSNRKNLHEALNWKDIGNKEFTKKFDLEALDYYNKALLKIPTESGRDLAIIRANRSAVLQHVEQYRLALIDINAALKLNYPNELKYKLYEREARCYLALKLHSAALSSFRKALSALSDAQIPTERKQQMQMDMQIMISMLNKDKKVLKQGPQQINLEVTKTRNEYLDTLTGEKNTNYPSASDAIRIECSEKLGRYAVANRDIDVGDTLLSEKASCAVLMQNLSTSHCQHCFIKTKAPIPCDTCDNVIFCSELCKTQASTYHKTECDILQPIWDAGISIICLMALRFITQKNVDFFAKLRNQGNLTTKEQFANYRKILSLVTHKDLRSSEDYFHRTVMALFILTCLEQTHYFQNSSAQLKYFIGGLIITYLEILQFNAHEVSELQMNVKAPKRVDLSTSVFLGGALFPTLALFNHSCDPGIIRYFHGTSVIARAAKNIKKGEIVAENYGPIYAETPLIDRKQILQEQYWFDCNCTPCMQNWPKFDELDPGILRFRCNVEKKCPNVIPINVNANQLFFRCNLCDQTTNLFKGLKALQETEALYKQASQLMENGDSSNALKTYIEIYKILDATLAPPFKDYLLCQQGIRKCMLDFGNKTI